MSTHDGPSKRRRIAGESKPSDAPRPGPARKVVKKPVARPGAPLTPNEPAPNDPAAVDAAPVDATPVEDRVDDTVEQAPPADGTSTDETSTDESSGDEVGADETGVQARAAAPRVAPRVGRTRSNPTATSDAPRSTDPAEESTSSSDATSGPRRERVPLGRLVLVVMTLAALAFGAVFGFRGVVEWRQTNGIEGAHARAAETAASAAETIFSYRYDQLEQYLEDSRDVMTPSFANDFETISPALNDLAPQRRIQVEATTRDSAPLPCGDDCRRGAAKVLIFVDQARLADGSQVPTVFGNRVELTMVERDGRWLVDDIKAL